LGRLPVRAQQNDVVSYLGVVAQDRASVAECAQVLRGKERQATHDAAEFAGANGLGRILDHGLLDLGKRSRPAKQVDRDQGAVLAPQACGCGGRGI